MKYTKSFNNLQLTLEDIKAAFSVGIKTPKAIQARLYDKELQTLTIPQIKYILKSLRHETMSGSLSVADLLHVVDQNISVPASEDESFVCHHNIDVTEEIGKFQIFFTTKRVSFFFSYFTVLKVAD